MRISVEVDWLESFIMQAEVTVSYLAQNPVRKDTSVQKHSKFSFRLLKGSHYREAIEEAAWNSFFLYM